MFDFEVSIFPNNSVLAISPLAVKKTEIGISVETSGTFVFAADNEPTHSDRSPKIAYNH